MNALAKFSIALLLVAGTAIGIYVFLAPDDEGIDAAQSQPQDATCKQDAERLARLQTNPSLNEGLRFVGEIRCMQLWPQLQTVMDGLSAGSQSTASSGVSGAASDAGPASHVEDGTARPVWSPTTVSLDDACKYDEDRLAKLQAHPSVDAAIRFDSELKCPKLRPQLPAILVRLSHDAGSVAAANRTAPGHDTASAGAAAPPAPGSPTLEAKSATPSDACKQDEERLAELQAKPSLDEVARFESELKCSRLQPQVLALLDGPSQAQQSARTQSPSGAAPNTVSIGAAAPPPPEPPPTPESPAQDTASATPSDAKSASEAVPPAAQSPSMNARPATPDDFCKQDEERLAALQAKPSLDEAVRFQGELKCSRLQPQLLVVLVSLTQAPGTEARPAAVTPSPSGVPAETASIGAAAPPASDSPAAGAATNASDAACRQDEERLARLRETPSNDEAARFAHDLHCETLRPQLLALSDAMAKPSPPDSVSVSEAPATKSGATNETPHAADTSAVSQAAVDANRRVAALESEKAALAEKVSRLEHDRDAASAAQAHPSASPPSANPSRSESESASQAAADAGRRIAQLESQQEALTAKVNQLERDRDAASAKQGVPLASPEPATPPKQFSSEPASQAAAEAERHIAELESEKDALTAEVGRLQNHDDAPSPGHANAPSPQPAVPAERSDAEIAATLASLPEGMPGRVLIRYLANNADARAQAEKLANALKGQGVEVADLRASAGALRTEVSFSYSPDEVIAREVGHLAGVAPVRRIQPKDGLMVRPGTIELNLSGESRAAAIKTTLRRESNHE